MAMESVILSNHLILCHPFLILPSIFPSIRFFSNKEYLQSNLGLQWPPGLGTEVMINCPCSLWPQREWVVAQMLCISSLIGYISSLSQCLAFKIGPGLLLSVLSP